MHAALQRLLPAAPAACRPARTSVDMCSHCISKTGAHLDGANANTGAHPHAAPSPCSTTLAAFEQRLDAKKARLAGLLKDQLKQMLRDRGLPVSGLKLELVDRLVGAGAGSCMSVCTRVCVCVCMCACV